jgi:hypothetical protein
MDMAIIRSWLFLVPVFNGRCRINRAPIRGLSLEVWRAKGFPLNIRVNTKLVVASVTLNAEWLLIVMAAANTKPLDVWTFALFTHLPASENPSRALSERGTMPTPPKSERR